MTMTLDNIDEFYDKYMETVSITHEGSFEYINC